MPLFYFRQWKKKKLQRTAEILIKIPLRRRWNMAIDFGWVKLFFYNNPVFWRQMMLPRSFLPSTWGEPIGFVAVIWDTQMKGGNLKLCPCWLLGSFVTHFGKHSFVLWFWEVQRLIRHFISTLSTFNSCSGKEHYFKNKDLFFPLILILVT